MFQVVRRTRNRSANFYRAGIIIRMASRDFSVRKFKHNEEKLYLFHRILCTFLRRHTQRRGPLSIAPSSKDASAPSLLHALLIAYYRILWSAPFLVDELDWPLDNLGTLF